MSLALKLVFATGAISAILVGISLLLKRYAPKWESIVPLITSAVALALSLIAGFKNELFDFKLRAIPGGITLAVPSGPSHRSPAIIYNLSFINEGYGHGVVEALALKIVGADGVRLYTPIAEVDYEKFLQGVRKLKAENVKGPFEPFVLGSKEATKHFVLLSQEEDNTKYPFREWAPGRYRFELRVKTSTDDRTLIMDSRELEITQEMIDRYFAGTGTVITDPKIDLD